MLQSGRDVRLVCARRASDGEPLPPSRLLLRAQGPALAARVLSIMAPDDVAPTLAARRRVVDRADLFDPYPMPSGEPVIRSMSVTSFSRFINDPYTFMIERDARIKAQEVDLAHQLDAMGFGTMLHDSLEHWGRQELDQDQPTTDAAQIVKDMSRALELHVEKTFGKTVAPGVRLQVAMARHRLTALAHVQAARAAEGWRIHQIEHFFGPPRFADAPWPKFPDEDGLYLSGRIDRVDIHDTHGYQALDYKSGRSAEGPAKVHKNRNGWKDLQLPLYRVLLRSIDIEVPSNGLGYVLVPPQASMCRIDIANWTDAELEEAEAEAAEIVRIVTQGQLLETAEASLT
jgi:RecB family exonuclease